MSEFKLFSDEKKKVDQLIAEGYRINTVKETLDGDEVEFIHPKGEQPIPFFIQTAEGRKYYVNLIKALQKPHYSG